MIALIAAVGLMFDPGDPDPASTLVLDGTSVTVAELRVLNDAFASSKTSDAIEISFAKKPASAMPTYDPRWHYAGSTVDGRSVIHSVVWLCPGADSHETLVDMAAGLLMSVMDSGFAGTYWKSFYDAEAVKDRADLSRTANPFFHRELVALRVAQAMYP